MTARRSASTGRLVAIFALSGFSALVYQSMWGQYLGLTLGHAAYAQTLVLAIFMGGLALGSWLASRRVRSLRNALLAYAAIEAAIGLCGLLFHPAFVAYTAFSQDTALPALGVGWVHAYQWSSAALLILPQCIALGTTFPLMASCCLRIEPDAQARSLGGLYAGNSLGAAIGALVATFVLLPRIGMPGAMLVAGLVNLLVAWLAWRMAPSTLATESPEQGRATMATQKASPRLLAGVLVAAGITGATSFVYEVVWVRMLDLALGTTLHSFELMLAAFILGLAAGGWWIRRRGERTGNALWLAGVAQVLMGLCALASSLAFGQSFRFVAWLMHALPHTPSGYAWFNLGSAGVALLVMFPAAFFAGSTLPLFTLSLLRAGAGERAVGRVYAANTLGAIVGVLAVVHLLIPGLGLHLSLLLAALLDLALGVVLLAAFGAARARQDPLLALLAAVPVLALALVLGRIDPLHAASGVYRSGLASLADDPRIEYAVDGRTATVDVFSTFGDGVLTIATNGKPDAGMSTRFDAPPVPDEVTMVMLGALPLALHEHPADVAAIGWGSGLTTHTLLGSPRVRRMETIEIEPAMVDGARLFGDRVARAYSDPRSAVVYDDARSHLAAARSRYDVLVSEPSNPWVSGVASLFTGEFYGFSARHLKPGGLFVQWLQSYELGDALQARMIGALLQRFAYVDAYLANDSDLLLVASAQPLPALDTRRLAYAPLEQEVRRVALGDDTAFALRRLGGREVLAAYVRMQGGEAGHSDFHPEVALHAPRDRFTNEVARVLPLLPQIGLPVLDLVAGRRVPELRELDARDGASSLVQFQFSAALVCAALRDPAAVHELVRRRMSKQARAVARVLALSRAPVASADVPEWSRELAVLARYGPGALAPVDSADTWIEPAWLAPGQGAVVASVMAAYRAAALRDAAAMRTQATAVLALDARLAPELRHQMLLIAMAGAAGQRDRAAILALERRFGASMPRDDNLGRVRGFLVAWAELPPR